MNKSEFKLLFLFNNLSDLVVWTGHCFKYLINIIENTKLFCNMLNYVFKKNIIIVNKC